MESPQLVLQLSQPSVPLRVGQLLLSDSLRARLAAIANGQPGRFWLSAAAACGKSTALRASAEEARQLGRSSAYMMASSLIGQFDDQYSTPFVDLEKMDLICIDDVDRLLGDPAAEEALFHLLNRCIAVDNTVLLSSLYPSQTVQTQVPDLLSRLRGAERLYIEAFNDEQLHQLMTRIAEQVGINWQQRFSDYLLQHRQRQPSVLIAAVRLAAQRAQAERRLISLRFLTMVLAQVNHDTDAQHDAGNNND